MRVGRYILYVRWWKRAKRQDEDLKSAQAYSEKLEKDIFPDLRIALVHGRMKGKEKERIMATFAAGEIDILVATTVIEVGVDVPNAALMVVENADRFGLSQLHQLRGTCRPRAASVILYPV